MDQNIFYQITILHYHKRYFISDFLKKTEAFASTYKGPVSLIWGKKDPILGRLGSAHKKLMPHATLQETDGGHFIQEEYPELIVQAIRQMQEK